MDKLIEIVKEYQALDGNSKEFSQQRENTRMSLAQILYDAETMDDFMGLIETIHNCFM